MTTIVSEHFEDVVFDLDDGRQICVSISKDGRFRLIERESQNASWSAPTEGWVVK